MIPWRVISFGSTNPAEYAEAAQCLSERCQQLGIDSYVKILDFGNADRKDIVLRKPTFIREQLERSPVKTLWLDCDAAVVDAFRSFPSDEGWDVGFLPNTMRKSTPQIFSTLSRLVSPASRWTNTVSGFAVALRPTKATFHFLKVWEHLCAWRDLAEGGDHKRMCWARRMVDLREINIAGHLQGVVVRDKGRGKEHDLRGLENVSLGK